MTQYIVYVSETLEGHAVFDTEAEAKAFADGDIRDFDLIKWTDSEFHITQGPEPSDD